MFYDHVLEIQPSEIADLIEDPVIQFKKSFKSPVTAYHQTNSLRKVLCEFLAPVLKGDPELLQKARYLPANSNARRKIIIADFEVRCREFVNRSRDDPKWSEAVILKILYKLEERTKLDKKEEMYLTKGAARNYYFPIQRLLECGNVNLPWKRIHRHVPQQTGHGGRAFELTEIQNMLKTCNVEEKPLVLIPAASGVREGGLWFRWEHIFRVYRYDNQYVWEPRDITPEVVNCGYPVCGLIHIYADTEDNDDYFGLITPECLDAIDEYREFWKSVWNQAPKLQDPFFYKHIPTLKPLKESGIRERMEIIQERCGLRPKLPPHARRHEVQPFTGFRKFFDKATKKAKSNNSSVVGKLILNEKMMGHGGLIPLNKNYFREVIVELIDEYIPAIPALTISEDAKRKYQNSPKETDYKKILDEAYLENMSQLRHRRTAEIKMGHMQRQNEELQKAMQELQQKMGVLGK